MKKFAKIFFLCLAIAATGCNSIAKTHHQRLERISRAHDEIANISKKLQDIEQIMLYIGRVRDSPLADAALDVAISIHGEPDDSEKQFAEKITADAVEAVSASVLKLKKRKAALELISQKDRQEAIDESYALHAMESRYKFFEGLMSNCAMAVCAIVAIFMLKKFL
jgi:predicted nucleotidyltransferase